MIFGNIPKLTCASLSPPIISLSPPIIGRGHQDELSRTHGQYTHTHARLAAKPVVLINEDNRFRGPITYEEFQKDKVEKISKYANVKSH